MLLLTELRAENGGWCDWERMRRGGVHPKKAEAMLRAEVFN